MDRIIQVVWEEAAARLSDTRARQRQDDLALAADLMAHAPQVCAYGVGASRLAAAHLALRLSRAGRTARHLDADGFRLADELLALRSGDVLVLFAPGRAGNEVLAALARAKDVGAKSILVTDHLRGELGAGVDVVLDAPHTPTGLTSEPLAALLLVDVLVQAVSRFAPEDAVETSHALGVIRRRLGYEEK
jgi:DNA-binding MurR/RpiR family transcriptional regulator